MMDLSSIPECGTACLISSLSASTCAAMDTACLCADQHFTDVVTSCVASNCTIRQALVVKNATMSSCGFPETNRDTSLLIITVVLVFLQTLFFTLRMLCRATGIAQWGWDDTTIVVAFACTTSFAACSFIERNNGVGRNIWTLSPEQIDNFLKVFFVFEVIYTFGLAIIKMSICCLYTRIFPGRRIRIAVWATQVFNVVLLTTFLLCDGLQCRPISFFWLGWDGEHEGTCWDLAAFFYVHAMINIGLDVWMLALPASQIWKLNVPARKKAGVFAMFGFGIILTVFSIIRSESVKKFANSTNLTMDFYPAGVWSAVELTAGLIVACMPGARLFVLHCVRRLFASNQSRLATEPKHPPSGHSSTKVALSPARTLSRKLQRDPYHASFSSKDLDRNRRYSMCVTVTSTGKFEPSEAEDLQDVDEGGRAQESAEELGGGRLTPSADSLGLPERSLSSETQLERQRRIWVTQNVSVSSRAGQSHRHDLRDQKAEVDYEDV